VPGGIGPVEMAVLAERLIHQHAAPDLASWAYRGPGPGLPLTTAHRDVVLQLERTAGHELGQRAGAQDEQQRRTRQAELGEGLELD